MHRWESPKNGRMSACGFNLQKLSNQRSYSQSKIKTTSRSKCWAWPIMNFEIFYKLFYYWFLIDTKIQCDRGLKESLNFEVPNKISATAYRCSRCWKNMFLTSSEPYVAFCRLDIARYNFSNLISLFIIETYLDALRMDWLGQFLHKKLMNASTVSLKNAANRIFSYSYGRYTSTFPTLTLIQILRPIEIFF